MIGELHTIVRASGSWSSVTGDWEPGAEKRFDVLGCLEQVDPLVVTMDPVATSARSRWRLTVAEGEPDLMIGSDDQRIGDRLIHDGKFLAVVGRSEAPRMGGLARYVYDLTDPGRDPVEATR